jgi:hypothetical protein
LVDKILVNGSFPAGIEPLDKQEAMVCYPTPSQGRFYIMLPREWEGTKEIVVYDMLGQTVLSRTDISNKVLIDSQLAPGAYSVSVSNSNLRATTKIIIE